MNILTIYYLFDACVNLIVFLLGRI